MKRTLLIFQIVFLLVCLVSCGNDSSQGNNIATYAPIAEQAPKVFVGAKAEAQGLSFDYAELDDIDGDAFLQYLLSLDLVDFEEHDFTTETQLHIKEQVMVRMETDDEITAVIFIRNDEELLIYIVKHIAGSNEQSYLRGELTALDFEALLTEAKKYNN